MRTLTRAIACCTAALALTAIASGPSGVAIGQENPLIHIVGPPNDGYKAIFYGIHAGIFQKYGLNVQATTVNSGSAAAAVLIGGSAEVSYTNMLTAVQAHNRGIPMQIIGASGMYLPEKPLSSMLVLKTSSIQNAHDLNGLTLGSPSLGDLVAISTQAWIDKNGGDSHSVHIIEAPASAAVAMLEGDRIAAVTLNEPAASDALATGKVRVLGHPFGAIGSHFQTAAYTVMAPYVDKNRETMRKFAQALHESQGYTNTHLDQTVTLVSSYSGATPESVARSVRFIDPEYVEVQNIQPVIDAFARYGAITKSFPAQELISSAALSPPR